MRDSFIIYSDTYSAVKKLSNEQAGELLHAIFKYQIDGEVQKLTPLVDMAFEFFKNHLDRDNEKWRSEIEKRSYAGRLGGIKSGEVRRKNNEANTSKRSKCFKNEANEADSVSVSVNDSVSDNVSVNNNTVPSVQFVIPTIEDISKYCIERNNKVDPEAFWHYYNTRGWVLSNRKKMRDWRSAVITWEKNSLSRKKQGNIDIGLNWLNKQEVYDV